VIHPARPRVLAEHPGRRRVNPHGASMKRFVQAVRRFLASPEGPTAVEYSVMLALIVVVCLTAIRGIGTNANKTFSNVSGQLGSTITTSS